MNQELIDIAKEAGFQVFRAEGLLPHVPEDIFIGNMCVTKEVKAFAKLVAAAEREACAKLCDVLAVHPEYASEVTKLAAAAIRARGDTK